MPMEIIARQVAHMTALVDDLLDVSRVTRGMVSLQSGEVDLREVVDSAVEQSRSLFQARRHSLTVNRGPERHAVYGDRNRLVQIVANLLNNAAKFTPEGGRIALSLRQDGGMVELTVEDNGVGIREEMLPRVFDLFTQGERSFDRAQGGLGLGLALVKRLVELHGGSVRAESPGSGMGSTFTVRMPCFVGESRSTSPAVAAADRRPVLLRLLIVDDNADAAISLATLLKLDGHTTSVEHDSRKALRRAIEDCAFDAMIVDIGMPGMDGYELARRVRAEPKSANVMLVALTGYGQAEDRDRSRAAGFDYHLIKPADITELQRILASARGSETP
jgi:CheY-like chemotaxis protein